MSLKNWFLLLGLTTISIAGTAADNKDGAFRPGPATSYPNHQKGAAGVVLAAEAFVTDEQAKPAFGKLNPYKHGVLPVLLVVQNGSEETISFERVRVEYIDASRRNLENVPAKDVPYLSGPQRPTPTRYPIPTVGKVKRNPLAALEIESRAFAARMLPPGESAHGFFYFQTDHRAGAILYVTGLRRMPSGQELFYFEIPLPLPGAR